MSHVVGLSSMAELPELAQRSQEVLNADSSNGNGHDRSPEGQSATSEHPLLQQPPLEWFGPLAEELLALQPQKLGKVPPRHCTLGCNMAVCSLNCTFLRSPGGRAPISNPQATAGEHEGFCLFRSQ